MTESYNEYKAEIIRQDVENDAAAEARNMDGVCYASGCGEEVCSVERDNNLGEQGCLDHHRERCDDGLACPCEPCVEHYRENNNPGWMQ